MKYINELQNAILDEDFFKTNELLTLVSSEENSLEYISLLLHFMEDNPDIDYGMPGPVVHFMEKYYKNGYEELLYESLDRKPTIHTLWMLNRVLNSPTMIDRKKYLTLLEKISVDPIESEDIRNEAKEYLDYQKG